MFLFVLQNNLVNYLSEKNVFTKIRNEKKLSYLTLLNGFGSMLKPISDKLSAFDEAKILLFA